MSGRTGGRWAAVAAAACAMAAALAALPPAAPRDAGGRAPAAASVRQVAVRAPAKCADPEASLRPSIADGPAVQRIKSRGRLIAGVDQNSYRWGYRDPATRELSGFDIDLVRAVAKAVLGDPDKVTFLAIPTNQRIPALEKGKVDIIARTMTINCDRIKQVAFSTAYFEAGQQVLAPKGSPVTAFDDSLKGKKVCTAKGSTGESELRAESHGATVLTVPNQLDCLVRLQLGQVDAVITDSALAAGQAAQDPSVRLVGKPFTTESYGVAMNLGDQDLVRRVNAVLEDYRRGGAESPWMVAYRKWLAADLKGITAPPEPKYKD
ncbi:glutamate ABC transporter substrate-binding protein [Streptomyces triculaminicus]|uniref:Glutamate ABC transporter substrate-binding protein n=2 Tax=Streptomyces TaxID=1883 RepID=A0A939JNB6_9ACTN|nr:MULTISPECIES: glutamate ABC transporter substrate-binding protein [Streptomyces]MBO0651462.1 glutamate ABC transporter substrate-binding protein [Streptomyces triculaminicus]QSY47550.1 glutamate ABC transporter substrate-binding protein [Streptomyces griseocarneus]